MSISLKIVYLCRRIEGAISVRKKAFKAFISKIANILREAETNAHLLLSCQLRWGVPTCLIYFTAWELRFFSSFRKGCLAIPTDRWTRS